MDSPRRVMCKMCKGLNDPRNTFCEYCGESLREQGYKETGGKTTGRMLARGVKRVVFVAVVLAVFGGVYYAVDRFLLPALQADSPEVVQSTTTVSFDLTTSTTNPRTDRVIAGKDRYATSVAISRIGFPSGASGVVLAGSATYVEAICAAPLAAAYGGPVLLLPPDGVSDELAAELTRLKPGTVFLVGVERVTRTRNQVRDVLDDVEVKALAGDNVHETAALIAMEVKAKVGKVEKVVVVPSDSFQEGLAVASMAGVNGWPILLKPKDGDLPRTTKDAIADLEASSALVVGTEAELDLSDVETKTGADGYETCALVAAYAVEHGLSFEHTVFVTGEDYPDGLSAGPYLAADKGMLLLSKPASLPDSVRVAFDAHAQEILRLDFVGLRDLAKDMAVAGSQTTTTAGQTEDEGATTTMGGTPPD